MTCRGCESPHADDLQECARSGLRRCGMKRHCVGCAFAVPVDPYSGLCEVCTAGFHEDLREIEEARFERERAWFDNDWLWQQAADA